MALTAGWGAESHVRERWWSELARRYGEPHRRYHTLAHIGQCLDLLDEVVAAGIVVADPARIELGLWFHDAVYVSWSGRNEEKSAELALRALAELRAPEPERVGRFVRATKAHADPADDDDALGLDLDMSILGADPVAFAQYQRDVRAEYAWVPDWFFDWSRGRFLRAVLARPAVFLTAGMRERFEASARRNGEAALAALAAPSGGRAVSFDEDAVWTTERGRLVETVPWADVERVLVLTTDEGPFVEDVFVVLVGGERGVVAGQGDEGARALLDRLLALPGFDHARFVTAMECTSNARFEVWERGG
jgi:predicted metal-dependent HD superfamily phosphohydrolase